MKFLAILLTGFLLTASPLALAADEPEEMGFGETNRRAMKIESHPCYQEHGVNRIICVSELNKGKVIERDTGGIGRRVQALQEGKALGKSLLVPKWMTEPKRIDLRSSSEQMQALLKDRKMAGKEQIANQKEKTPTVRIRTKPGTRADDVAIPVCTRRHGLMLVSCLKELGVEINENTVDPLTFELFRQSQMPMQQ